MDNTVLMLADLLRGDPKAPPRPQPIGGLLAVGDGNPFTGGLLGAATVNPLMAQKVNAQRQTMPVSNMLTEYNASYPKTWGEFGDNVKQSFPTPASGGTREQILAAAQNLAMGIGPQMIAYHGSPHKFDKFDMSKIGTGEGAQAYGHGLYFAESPSVAKEYQRKLAGSNDGMAGKIAANALQGRNPNDAIAYLESTISPNISADAKAVTGQAIDILKSGNGSKGSLYKVDLPDEQVAKMLDWDKPLSQQPESVRAAVFGDIDQAIADTRQALSTASARRAPTTKAELEKLERERNRLANLTGGDYYKQQSLGVSSGKPNATEMLRNAGIPGIRYLDGGSRTGGKGTSNFVVFDDKLPKILGRE